MSVGLYKYDGDIYEKYWEKAIKELNIKHMQDGAEIHLDQKDAVMKELELLLSWAKENLHGKDLDHMKCRIENLQKIIPTALADKNDILYIF